VQGQLDLFWVSAQVSVPFVIAGVCLGAQARAVEAEPVVPAGTRLDRGARELAIGAG
jgi:hypothetical protein